MIKLLERSTQLYDLRQFPRKQSLLWDVLCSSFKKPSSSSVALHLGAKIHGVRFQSDWLKAYQQVCGFEPSNQIPLTAPQVVAVPLHLFLFSRKAHPFSMLGMVHTANQFQLHQPLQLNQDYTVVVLIGETRTVTKGCEWDVHTEWYDAQNTLVWGSTMTVFSRIPGMTAALPSAPVEKIGSTLNTRVAGYLGLQVSPHQGYCYAQVSGDFNPIHLHHLTAKMFGFNAPIAHGMWTAAACLGKLEQTTQQHACSLEVVFKKPVVLSSQAVVKYETMQSHAQFELMSLQESRILVSGACTFL